MEEENLKNYISMYEKLKRNKDIIDNIDKRFFFEFVDTLIKAYKELEEENKIIKGNYYTLCVDIQMVTSELGFPEDTIIADEFVSMIKENYIEKSLVEEKIEEYTNLLMNCNRFSDVDRIKSINERVLAYKELLEKRG